MRPQFIMFLAWIMIMATLFSLMMDGAWVRAEDVRIINFLTGYNAFSTGGFIPVVTTTLSVFSHIYILITWDYSFLQGALGIIRWILGLFTIGAVWAIGQEFRYMLMGIFGRR